LQEISVHGSGNPNRLEVFVSASHQLDTLSIQLEIRIILFDGL